MTDIDNCLRKDKHQHSRQECRSVWRQVAEYGWDQADEFLLNHSDPDARAAFEADWGEPPESEFEDFMSQIETLEHDRQLEENASQASRQDALLSARFEAEEEEAAAKLGVTLEQFRARRWAGGNRAGLNELSLIADLRDGTLPDWADRALRKATGESWADLS